MFSFHSSLRILPLAASLLLVAGRAVGEMPDMLVLIRPPHSPIAISRPTALVKKQIPIRDTWQMEPIWPLR